MNPGDRRRTLDCGPWLLRISNKRVRVERAWSVILFIVAAALCFVPLFDVLGYEWALVMAIVASLGGAHVGAMRVWRERRERAPSALTAAAARPGATVAALWGSATLRAVGRAGVAARRRCCQRAARAQLRRDRGPRAWFAMLPLLSAAMGCGAGVIVGLLRRWRGRVAPTALALGVVVASVGWGVWRFYAAPPIFGYDPFVGYFAGTLYDEDIAITAAFGWARLYHVAWLVLLLALVRAPPRRHDADASRLRPRAARGRSPWSLRRWRSWRRSSSRARRSALRCRPRTSRAPRRRDAHRAPGPALLADRTLRQGHRRLRRRRRVSLAPARRASSAPRRRRRCTRSSSTTPGRSARSWAPGTPSSPSRGGARSTCSTTPGRKRSPSTSWRTCSPGRFGDPIFGIARRGLAFNVGLIEGVAVAASWAGQPLTPHQSRQGAARRASSSTPAPWRR